MVCEPVFNYLLNKFDGITAGDAGIINGTAQPGWKTKLTCDQINKQEYKDAGDDTTHNVGYTLRAYGPACCGDKGIICNGALGALAPMYVLMFAATAASLLSSVMW